MELITKVLSQDERSVISQLKFDSMEVLFVTVLSLDYADIFASHGNIWEKKW